MNMNMQSTRFWTFGTLVGAFLDLFIAYFLLCASTIALFAVKFLGFFGLSLPTPYNGLLGIRSPDYRSLLVDYPTDKISAVHFSVTRKFPFDSILFGVHNLNLNKDLNLKNGDGLVEFEGEASCSSKSDARKLVGNEIDDSGVVFEMKRGFDMKGKEGLNYRFRGGFRLRRKAGFDSSKQQSSVSSSNWVTCDDHQSNNDEEHSGQPEGSLVLFDVNNCDYEAETPVVVKSGSRYEEDIVFVDPNDAQKKIPVNEDENDKMIALLACELEKSQAARAALYVELEKERNAAASAADEAMSMILRLQVEKASTKMEFGQYQRMIEEKSVFDAEEMNILKEIVLRREREKHFLEKQVEAYRQMIRVENDQINGGNDQDFTQKPSLMLDQLNMNISEEKTSSLYDDVYFSRQEEIGKTKSIVGEGKCLEVKPGDTSCAYDVYVIYNEPKLSEKTNENKKQTDQNRRNSTSALDNERTRLDTVVEWLRERLRIVHEGRGKLKFSLENLEKESLWLDLLEDIAHRLQEIQALTEPQTARQASLPLPSSKVGLTKKRRCRSVSSGLAQSS
ncbi:hypothetical protein R6Q59_013553 [Mikania micrantha]